MDCRTYNGTHGFRSLCVLKCKLHGCIADITGCDGFEVITLPDTTELEHPWKMISTCSWKSGWKMLRCDMFECAPWSVGGVKYFVPTHM